VTQKKSSFILEFARSAPATPIILYRPVGSKELELIQKSSYKEFLPRLS
jgi:hypothetical protein